MPRNARTYDHFCTLARAVERIGDRWSLLVVRDLLSGPKRFTDLMDRCGGITPKTLTQRLRQLQDSDILTADRVTGRREVWYALTAAGADLAPAVDALTWWGLRHAWRPPRPGEPLHAEHLLHALTQVLNHTGDDKPAHWRLDFPQAHTYHLHTDGSHWRLTTASPNTAPDIAITAATTAWTQFIADPTPLRAAELGIQIDGDPAARRHLHRLLRAFPAAITPTEHPVG